MCAKVSKDQGLEAQVSKFQGFRVSRYPIQPSLVFARGSGFPEKNSYM
jgi:hypothetical protein